MRHRRDLLFVLMAAYALGYFFLMRLPGDVLRSPIAGSDLSSYYTAGYLVRSGRAAELYAVSDGDSILGDATAGPYREAADERGVRRQHYYIYPPLFALLAAPLSFLSFGAARLVWLASDLALLGVFIYLYGKWRRMDGTSPGIAEWALVTVTLFLEFLPLIWALAIGQTSLLLLALIVGSLVLVRRENDMMAGALLGIAAAIKLTPALLIVYFFWRGRRGVAMWAGGVAVLCTLLPMALLGPGTSGEFFMEVVPSMSGGTSYFLNQSFAALFNRQFTGGDVRQVALESSVMARVASVLCGLLVLGLTARVIARNGKGRPGGLVLDLEISTILLLTLLLSPISWSHHYVLALVPLYTLVAAAGRCGRRSLPVALSAGVALLLIARKPHFDLFLEGPWRVANSAALGGALVMLIGCLWMLWNHGGSLQEVEEVADA